MQKRSHVLLGLAAATLALAGYGQGLAALQMLNVLEGFDLAAMGHNSADALPGPAVC